MTTWPGPLKFGLVADLVRLSPGVAAGPWTVSDAAGEVTAEPAGGVPAGRGRPASPAVIAVQRGDDVLMATRDTVVRISDRPSVIDLSLGHLDGSEADHQGGASPPKGGDGQGRPRPPGRHRRPGDNGRPTDGAP